MNLLKYLRTILFIFYFSHIIYFNITIRTFIFQHIRFDCFKCC
uniref:Uncharacterized protein n=1 Tax=Escherichia coli TaxID=562 RepID=A0A890DHM2_ECOLX|nr:hypothetical protein [Escherichia coli]